MARIPVGRRFASLFVTLLLASLLLPTGIALASDDECQYYSACYLEMTSPETVTADQSFSVAVALKNGENVTTDACDGTPVYLYATPEGGEPDLLASGPLSGGSVAWDDLQLSVPATYELAAYLGGESCSAASDHAALVVEAAGVEVTCPPNAACTASLESASGNASAAVTAGPGATITAAFGTLDYTACGGTTPADPGGVLTFDVVNGKILKLVKLTIDASIASGKLSAYKVCWNAPTRFKTADGTWSPADPQGGFSGNLPNCLSKNPTLPCILLRSKDGAGNVSLFVIAKPGDPKGYISK